MLLFAVVILFLVDAIHFEELVVQWGFDRDSLFGVLFQHLHDKVLRFTGWKVKFLNTVIWIWFLDSGKKFAPIIDFERVFIITEKAIKNDASRPNVYLLLIAFLKEDLRCKVCWRATTLQKLLFGRYDLGQAEICDLDFDYVLLFVDENVFRFDISVDYTAWVYIAESLKDLVHDQSDLFLLQLVILTEIVQVASSDELGHNKYLVFILKILLYRYHVRVLHHL